jgi:hypothetical protein
VDPPAIDPYQQYINYLEDVVIFNPRQELASALASPDPTSTNDDDGPVTGPMVVKTNTGCEVLLSVPREEGKHSSSNSTPPPVDPTPPPSGYYMPSQHSGGSMMFDFSGYYSYN